MQKERKKTETVLTLAVSSGQVSKQNPIITLTTNAKTPRPQPPTKNNINTTVTPRTEARHTNSSCHKNKSRQRPANPPELKLGGTDKLIIGDVACIHVGRLMNLSRL
jgi:hypothetical protein